MKRRSISSAGFTLIELSITMTIGSFLLVLSVGLIHQVMRFNSVTQNRAFEHRVLDRLCSDFRRDVHQATKVEILSKSEFKLFYPNEKVVRYTAPEDKIQRQIIQTDGVERTESYEFKRSISVECTHQTEPELLSLTIAPGDTASIRHRVPQRSFSATLGRTKRHEQARVSDE